MVQYKLSAYWEAREENADACTERLFRFLDRLANCDPAFAQWYEKAMSRRKAKQVEIDYRAKWRLLDLVLRGRSRLDSDGSVIENLGFLVGMWNGQWSRKMAGLSIQCGLYATISCNTVILQLPEDLGSLRDCERMTVVLTAVVECWEPDWAGVYSTEAMNARDFNVDVPFVDWVVYISWAKYAHPVVSAPSIVQSIDNLGSLIVVQRDPPVPGDAAHLEKVRAVQRAIGIK